jgi:hypothetical protein
MDAWVHVVPYKHLACDVSVHMGVGQAHKTFGVKGPTRRLGYSGWLVLVIGCLRLIPTVV